MEKKPQDMLEFLRRSSGQSGVPMEAEQPPPRPELESTPRMLVLRRTQIVVASVAAGLLILLAFLIGRASRGGDPEAPVEIVGPWVLRVVTFDETDNGTKRAEDVVAQLEKLDWGEVTLQRIPSQGKLVVTLGAWVRSPQANSDAEQLRRKVRELEDRKSGSKPFKDADFWQIRR